MKSVTSVCSFCDFSVDGVSYRVVDTVGLQDTDLTTEELHRRFRQFADLAPNGVDAFFFVAKRGRFRPDHAQAFDAFEEACGSAVLKHTSLLFTCLEDESNSEFNESLESDDMPQTFRKCFEKVDGRAVGVENKLGGKARQLDNRQVVLSAVAAMKEINRGRYSNQQLQDARKWRVVIEQKAKQLEMPAHQQAVLHLLEDRLHGRCERSDVEGKVVALLKSEARLKAKIVLDVIALLGQLKETCERLGFETSQLRDRCEKRSEIRMGKFCAGHRDCSESYPGRQGNHPSNCSLHPLHTYPGQVAAFEHCQSTLVKVHKESLLCEFASLTSLANKDRVLQLMQHSPPAAAFQVIAAAMLASQERIQETCSLLARPCTEVLTFHIVLGYQRTERVTCGGRFDAEVTRIRAANSRVAELTKSMEELVLTARNEAAIRVQATFRGRAARCRASKMRTSISEMNQGDDSADDSEDQDDGEDNAVPDGFQDKSLPIRKRRTRRGGMNKRMQNADEVDTEHSTN